MLDDPGVRQLLLLEAAKSYLFLCRLSTYVMHKICYTLVVQLCKS